MAAEPQREQEAGEGAEATLPGPRPVHPADSICPNPVPLLRSVLRPLL